MSEYPEVTTLARLLELAARYGLEELEVEEDGLKVGLRATPLGDLDESGSGEGRIYLWQPPPWPETAAASGRSETAQPLTAPLTGIFYRADSPDVPPLVEVGTAVEEGQPVGLIEAMKVFSRIDAPHAGTVIEILAKNGQLVNHGEVLMYIEPQ